MSNAPSSLAGESQEETLPLERLAFQGAPASSGTSVNRNSDPTRSSSNCTSLHGGSGDTENADSSSSSSVSGGSSSREDWIGSSPTVLERVRRFFQPSSCPVETWKSTDARASRFLRLLSKGLGGPTGVAGRGDNCPSLVIHRELEKAINSHKAFSLSSDSSTVGAASSGALVPAALVVSHSYFLAALIAAASPPPLGGSSAPWRLSKRKFAPAELRPFLMLTPVEEKHLQLLQLEIDPRTTHLEPGQSSAIAGRASKMKKIPGNDARCSKSNKPIASQAAREETPTPNCFFLPL
eukprot:GHVT01004585.1.p1 GENE.GHVT01004585.1~~GHVT01004585.1.p1  ORF type:complete len:314 (+),score=64.45 GHVT01004585.1:59-943(+)